MNEKACGGCGFSASIMYKDAFEKAGFKQTEWLKDDPRGKEYGHFTARRLSDGNIEVIHNKDYYSMVFKSDQSFMNWSKANG